MSHRYEERPFLRLLECYVLWSIGHLAPSQEQVLAKMRPKLEATYETDGSWQEIVASQMDFPADLPDALRRMWTRTAENAGDQSSSLDPEVWARQVVDANFT